MGDVTETVGGTPITVPPPLPPVETVTETEAESVDRLTFAGLCGMLLKARAIMIAPPAVDEPAGPAQSEVAVLAGGCFWGVQGVFQHVQGVTSAVSGYTGGDKSTAQYETVGTGTTGGGQAPGGRSEPDPNQRDGDQWFGPPGRPSESQ